MTKQKKWQFYLILAVVALTVYNILPTLFFYSKPLQSLINQERATVVAHDLLKRINSLESESIQWVTSFCQLIQTNPKEITLDPEHPQFLSVSFQNQQEATTFRSFLPRAGALIPFVPAQLSLYNPDDTTSKTVVVERKIPVHFNSAEPSSSAQFSFKFDENHQPTPLYRSLIEDRALQIGMAIGGPSDNALLCSSFLAAQEGEEKFSLATEIAHRLTSFVKVYPEKSAIAARYFATFARGDQGSSKTALATELTQAFQAVKKQLNKEKETLLSQPTTPAREDQLLSLATKGPLLDQTISILTKEANSFNTPKSPYNFASLNALFAKSPSGEIQTISLEGFHPFISALAIDWAHERILLIPYADFEQVRSEINKKTAQSSLSDLADTLLYNEIASIANKAQETILPEGNRFVIALSSLENSQSFLALKLSSIAEAQLTTLQDTVQKTWQPLSTDFAALASYPYEAYQKLPKTKQQFALVFYAPAIAKTTPLSGFRTGSLYIIAKGANTILQRANSDPAALKEQVSSDFQKLSQILQRNGFLGYSGNSLHFGKEFSSDFIFECPDYYQTVLSASREDFQVHGTRRFATLDFTNVQQRILTENKIDNQIHEDLLKWRDDYHAAQLGLRGVSMFDVPKPNRSALWSNFQLSFIKYFRGDDRKILKWGLDLSGGKTVQIELRDRNHRAVTDPQDLKQGINELYKRVNKMGVSEVSIRQEGNFITLDFPGSQGLSAAELVKASQMFFHVVNEQFTPNNLLLKEAVEQFLQGVWNEAVVTNRKEIDDINTIACKHLYGDAIDPEQAAPLSDAARTLYASGLRLSSLGSSNISSSFDNRYSCLTRFRGEDFTDWQGQTHPLLVVFANFALEGSNLEDINASYDPSKGNFLSFTVKNSYTTRDGEKISPTANLFAWTSVYSKERLSGTPSELYSHGRGWRMAVILNGSVISAPTLDSALRDSAMISGSFTQREISQLEADLKAGSLSFTPHIVSEKNVSPELGIQERTHGIIATALSLFFVVSVMIGYYYFGGLVASIAVLFNLLIIWATLQNLQATLTLPGIAGIILTLAMAVDANVLVFERIREEFTLSSKISSAIQAGYKKAFSAIIDSNVTTIIAALVLLQFDSGPIRALAILLLIGILSSLFSALFMTRFFFTKWAQNPENKMLSMRNWFRAKNYNFLKHTKKTVLFSAVIVLVGSFVLVQQKSTLFGMDFKGGYALTVDLQPSDSISYREQIEQAFAKQGISSQDVQIRELSPSNHVRILLSYNLQEQGQPFYQMPLENDLKEASYRYEMNPKIVWVVQALSEQGLKLEQNSLQTLDRHWTEISGQMSDAMRNSALIGLSIALLCILVYITLRFEFKYAVSATLCLAHDVLFTLGSLALLHACNVPIQIDLNTVAALLTIIGYSLNDTIIVFDRIREEVRLMRHRPLSEIINHALNVTLSRTLMTSGTTLLVLAPLIFLGGSTLFGFALVLSIGVIFGTLSSLFIAAPLMKYFHDRDARKGASVVLNGQ